MKHEDRSPHEPEVLSRRGTGSIKWDLAADDELPLWVADMDFPSPAPVIDAVRRRLEHPLLGYSLPDPEIPLAFSAWCERRQGWKPKPEGILIGHSVLNTMAACILALTEPGDAVVVQQPVYHPFSSIPQRLGRRLLVNPLARTPNGTWVMDFDGLRDLCERERPALLMLCSPHNPGSRVWSRNELVELIALCREYDVIIVSDEIHADMIRPGVVFTSIGSLSAEDDSIIVVQSPSKTFNIPGLPSSIVSIHNPSLKKTYKERVSQLGQDLVGVLSQVACAAAYRYGDEWLDEVILQVDRNYRCLEERIALWRERWSMWADPVTGISMSKGEGTYLAWVHLKPVQTVLGVDTKALQARLRTEAHVWLSPGSQFGDGGEGWVRMNIGTSREIVSKALDRMGDWFDSVYEQSF